MITPLKQLSLFGFYNNSIKIDVKDLTNNLWFDYRDSVNMFS